MKRDLKSPLATTPPLRDDISEQVKKNRKKHQANISKLRREYTYMTVPGHQKGYVVKRDKPSALKATSVAGKLKGPSSLLKKFKK